MEVLGITFILKTGAFLHAVCPAQEAQDIVRNLHEGVYKLKGTPRIGSTNPPPGWHAWTVDVDGIQAAHTFVPQPPQQTTTTVREPWRGPPNYGVSGR